MEVLLYYHKLYTCNTEVTLDQTWEVPVDVDQCQMLVAFDAFDVIYLNHLDWSALLALASNGHVFGARKG